MFLEHTPTYKSIIEMKKGNLFELILKEYWWQKDLWYQSLTLKYKLLRVELNFLCQRTEWALLSSVLAIPKKRQFHIKYPPDEEQTEPQGEQWKSLKICTRIRLSSQIFIFIDLIVVIVFFINLIYQ